MLERKDLLEDIRLAFAVLQAYVSPGGSLNLTDINIHAEDFVGLVLNGLYGWELENTNTDKANFPCIDLIDRGPKIGIQVSSDNGSQKINDTIDCLKVDDRAKAVAQLKVFTLLPKQSKYTINSRCKGVTFNWRKDVMDFDMALAAIKNVKNERNLRELHRAITDAMPKVFASRRLKLEAIRDQLKQNLIVFDRDVMHVAAQYEDPLRMYRAIREMRVTLQKSGASHIANDLAAKHFTAARKILGDTEQQVRDRFPYIHDAAMEPPNRQLLRYDAYKGDDYHDAIRLMMEVRDRLQPGLEALRAELRRIEGEL